MSHGRHVHYGKAPPPRGVTGFIIHNTLPTMQYLLHNIVSITLHVLVTGLTFSVMFRAKDCNSPFSNVDSYLTIGASGTATLFIGKLMPWFTKNLVSTC